MSDNNGEAFRRGSSNVPSNPDPSTWNETELLNAIGILKRAAPQMPTPEILEETWETLTGQIFFMIKSPEQMNELHEAVFQVVNNPIAPDSLVSKYETWMRSLSPDGSIPPNAESYLAARYRQN
ncbi:hypothetical protein [Microbacterium sp. CIAB417]|uniref:hypothetical protein n=1 Tax=Microbacterium sp. CIAB417 TaxID=2860287 RepID=UPI001FAD57B7|nr:hypothetical protein [Microbacterium sp. CIAB417]